MVVYDETSNTMKVRWVEAEGATGYMLRYKSTNATEPQLEKEVKKHSNAPCEAVFSTNYLTN